MKPRPLRTWIIIGLVALTSRTSTIAGASEAPFSLQDQVESQIASPVPFSDDEMKKAQSAQYIFVDGFCGEYLKTSFLPAEAVVKEHWKDEDATILRPSSKIAIWENADRLYPQIQSLRQGSTKNETVIVAHSKGGAEVLLMVLRHPELISKLGITKIVLVAAPIRGTDLAELAEPASNPVTDFLNQEIPALPSFLPALINPIYADALSKLSAEEKNLIKAHVFYVRAQMSSDDIFSPLFLSHLLLSKAHANGSNDGLIPTENEVLLDEQGKAFGTDLGVMLGDHNSMTNDSIFPDDLTYRRAFFETLIRNILL